MGRGGAGAGSRGTGAVGGRSGTLRAMAAFSPAQLHELDVALEIKIDTYRDEMIRATVIWVVVDNGQVFVRSVRGARGVWYREALERPVVTLDDSGRRFEANAVPVHDEDSIHRVNEALKRKYAGQEGLDSMLTPEAIDATVRLDARFEGEHRLEAPAYLGSDEPSEIGTAVEVGMLDGGPAIEERVILQPQKPV
jgi:hypothetical protein